MGIVYPVMGISLVVVARASGIGWIKVDSSVGICLVGLGGAWI